MQLKSIVNNRVAANRFGFRLNIIICPTTQQYAYASAHNANPDIYPDMQPHIWIDPLRSARRCQRPAGGKTDPECVKTHLTGDGNEIQPAETDNDAAHDEDAGQAR